MGFRKTTITIIIAILFLLSERAAFAIPAMQQRCDPNNECIIGEYIFADDGYTPITTDNFCQITITDPNDTVIINNQNMLHKNDGWYYYSTSTLSSPEGLYRSLICCDSGTNRRCIDKTFILGTSFDTLPEKIWGYTGTALDTVGNAVSKVWNFATRSLTTRQIGTSTDEIARQYDIDLIRQATFDFAGIANGGSTTTLVDSELDQPDGYWNNYDLVMMSGANVGQKRVISGFDQNTNTITVSSAFPFPIASGDKYVISHENKLVNAIWNYTNRTLTDFGTLISDIWSYPNRTLTSFGTLALDTATAVWSNTTRTLTSFGTLVADVWSNPTRTLSSLGYLAADIWNNNFAPTRSLTTRQIGTNEYIAGVSTSTLVEQVASQSQVAEIRDSQQRVWRVYLSDVDQILAGKTYRAKLYILNYESVLTDPYTTSTVTIYDASRNTVVENVSMTKLSTGVYEYTYNVPSSAGAGLWETEVSTEVESGKIIKLNDFWEVEASPAQVKINSISDNTVPSIAANVTITNEGSAGYEYQYEYCVVNSIDNQCGGGDDVDYAKGAKYINPGESWTTDLGLTVSNTGTYYYKVYVYWGTEKSVAVKQFEAVNEAVSPSPPLGGGGSGGGGGGGAPILTPSPAACSGADFNNDNIVNSVDFSILLYFWKTKPPFRNPCVDINGDNKIDSIDFSILLYQWGKPGIPYKNYD